MSGVGMGTAATLRPCDRLIRLLALRKRDLAALAESRRLQVCPLATTIRSREKIGVAP
jgi:hypothetical protein